MIGIWYFIIGASDISDIKKNWSKYRCQTSIMPFASFYGHDTNENFQFCMKQLMNDESSGILAPIFKILGTFLMTLETLIETANSIRLQFATFMGGVNTIFQNFTDRISQLVSQIQLTAIHMKMLMGRLYATFFALMFMSVSGVSALHNFGDTVLFKFLDTFCFDPDTLVIIKGKGSIPVKDVQIGDIFEKGESSVTSIFKFNADGQPMVNLNGIIVSTNHYVFNKSIDKYVRADQHPDSYRILDWNGGLIRPLICFNTSDHHIPIANHIFMDYDETEIADADTMKWIHKVLNGTTYNNKKRSKSLSYTTVFSGETRICMKNDTFIHASRIKLGDILKDGTVISVIKKEVYEYSNINGDRITSGCLIWDNTTNKWTRAGELYAHHILETPEIFYNFIISPCAFIETKNGTIIRDYMEVHSPDAEQFYAKAIECKSREEGSI